MQYVIAQKCSQGKPCVHSASLAIIISRTVSFKVYLVDSGRLATLGPLF